MEAWGFGKRFETEGAGAGGAETGDLDDEDFRIGVFFADDFGSKGLDADGMKRLGEKEIK